MQISKILNNALEIGIKFARSLGLEKVETEHLLFAILLEKNANCVKILNNLGINDENLKKLLISGKKNANNNINKITYSNELSSFISKSLEVCQKLGKKELGIDEIMYFMVCTPNLRATKIIKDYYKLNLDNLKNKFELLIGITKETVDFSENKSSGNNISLPESLLNIGYDLTKKIKNSNFQKIIGRDSETEKVIYKKD
jgi:ATP-dependent Clp protease ATP-binding subunit ClpA